MSLGKIIRSVYDATSDSRSSFGKIGRWINPLAQYTVRDLWRKYAKPYFNSSNSAGSLVGGSDIYGPTGSIVGRY